MPKPPWAINTSTNTCRKNGCCIVGEQSGYIIITKYASTGDGILTSLKMMEVMMARKKTLSQLCEGLTIYLAGGRNGLGGYWPYFGAGIRNRAACPRDR